MKTNLHHSLCVPVEDVCVWSENEDGNWETGCGDEFVFETDGPVANHCKYCCYCGRPLREEPYTEPEDDDA